MYMNHKSEMKRKCEVLNAAAENRIGFCCSPWELSLVVFILIFSVEVSVLKKKNCSYSLILDCDLFFISSLMETQVRLII